MKKIVCIMTALCLLFGITACAGGSSKEKNTSGSKAGSDGDSQYTMDDVSYAVMAETVDGDMRITDVSEASGSYLIGLIDATNTGDSSGAMSVTMTKEQYDNQIKGKKKVKCDAKKTVFLVPCNKTDRETYKALAFEYTFVKTSLDTEDANKDYMDREMATLVLKDLNSQESTEKANHLCTITDQNEFDLYRSPFHPVD